MRSSPRTGRADLDPEEHPRVVRELGARSTAAVRAELAGGGLAAVATAPDRFTERDPVFLGGVTHWLALIARRADDRG